MNFVETEHGLINAAYVIRIMNNEDGGRMVYYQFGQQVMSAPCTDEGFAAFQSGQNDAVFRSTGGRND